MTTDELRAKFENWWLRNGDPFDLHKVAAWEAWQAAYASRDAEVEALRKRINDAPVYYVSDYFAAKALCGWLQVIGSVKALKDMRGKHVRLVIDAAMREGK